MFSVLEKIYIRSQLFRNTLPVQSPVQPCTPFIYKLNTYYESCDHSRHVVATLSTHLLTRPVTANIEIYDLPLWISHYILYLYWLLFDKAPIFA